MEGGKLGWVLIITHHFNYLRFIKINEYNEYNKFINYIPNGVNREVVMIPLTQIKFIQPIDTSKNLFSLVGLTK